VFDAGLDRPHTLLAVACSLQRPRDSTGVSLRRSSLEVTVGSGFRVDIPAHGDGVPGESGANCAYAVCVSEPRSPRPRPAPDSMTCPAPGIGPLAGLLDPVPTPRRRAARHWVSITGRSPPAGDRRRAELAAEDEDFFATFNEIRPHESLAKPPPLALHREDQHLFQGPSLQEPWHGTQQERSHADGENR